MAVLFFGSLCAVLGTRLHASCNALGVKRSANDVVTAARQVTDSSSADQHNGVLLQIVSDPRDIGRRLQTVCQSHSGDLAERGVRLLRADGGDLRAHAPLLGRGQIRRAVVQGVEALLQHRRLGFVHGFLAAVFDQLIKGRHLFPPFLEFFYSILTGKSTAGHKLTRHYSIRFSACQVLLRGRKRKKSRKTALFSRAAQRSFPCGRKLRSVRAGQRRRKIHKTSDNLIFPTAFIVIPIDAISFGERKPSAASG